MASLVELSRLRSTLSYDGETGDFFWIKLMRGTRVGQKAGYRTKGGRVEIRVDGKLYYAHRLAWFFVHGKWPREIDHINRDQSDNRIKNLREATSSENNANQKLSVRNTSGKKGVHWHSGLKKWRARIRVRGRYHSLGCYSDLSNAHEAYAAAAKKHFGEFARTE